MENCITVLLQHWNESFFFFFCYFEGVLHLDTMYTRFIVKFQKVSYLQIECIFDLKANHFFIIPSILFAISWVDYS